MTPEQFYSIFKKYRQICTDSRVAIPGSLFFALHGERFNGNRFAGAALDKGCRLAVVDDPLVVRDERYLLVENTLAFLQDLAAWHRRQLTVPVLAITGTNGKTTTKGLIRSVLGQQFRVTATKGNLNNHIGVPLTLLQADEETEILVIEMGVNHPGEISNLCRIADPTHGLVTNIGRAHFEGFGSFEGVKAAKKELYDYCMARQGVIFQNGDDQLLRELTGNYSVITYGTRESCRIRGDAKENGRLLEIDIIKIPDHTPGPSLKSLTTHLSGGYNLYNVLAAIAVGIHFGVPYNQVAKGISSFEPERMRSEWIQTAENMILMDAYNANPTSMHLALNHFASLDLTGKVIILGDMFELGKESLTEHKRIIDEIGKLGFNEVYLAGENFMKLAGGTFQAFRDTASLKAYLDAHRLSGKNILIKGSRGMGLEILLDYL